MKLLTLIVDDEKMARVSLEHLCEKIEAVEIVGNYESAEEALEFMNTHKVDLLLLDIEMPGLSGLELLEKLPYIPQVIFITSNTDYAYDAFEYDVTDFIKKPVAQPRLLKAIEKAIRNEERINEAAISSASKEIYIKTEGRFVRIPYEDILYFENVGDYVKVWTENHGNHIIYGALKSIDSRLNNPRLLKVHRSYIINLDKIKDIEDNTIVIMKKVIPISRAHKPLLMRSLNILKN